MRLSTLSLFIFLFPIFASAEDFIPKSAPHCNVDQPPVTSGEDSTHAILIKVFPRKSNVGVGYTGCQTMWIKIDNQWNKFSVMYYDHGALNVWWNASDKNNSGMFCRFENGKLLAGEEVYCYEPAHSGLKPSYESGCMEAAILHGEMSETCRASLEH
jgi:hypothetical protein